MKSIAFNVFRRSADAMRAILELHFPSASIVDVTYGRGVFYQRAPGGHLLVGLDVRPTAHVVGHCGHLPFGDDAFDVGVIDPPYKRGDDFRYLDRYGAHLSTETQVLRLYQVALVELLRVARAGLVVKVQDGTDGHRFHPKHAEVIDEMRRRSGLWPHDIAYVVRSGAPDRVVQGSPHFFRQGVSHFLIYKWREKSNSLFKPWRF